VWKEASGDFHKAVELAYRTALGRSPTPIEFDHAQTYIADNPDRLKNFTWLLFNLDEFVYVR
jgi:hypothetical protein